MHNGDKDICISQLPRGLANAQPSAQLELANCLLLMLEAGNGANPLI